MNSQSNQNNQFSSLRHNSLNKIPLSPHSNSGSVVNTSMNVNSANNLSTIAGNVGISNPNSNSSIDPDEQFVLDIIRSTKQESISNLVEMLRLQESKSVLLIRILERYRQQLDNKELLK